MRTLIGSILAGVLVLGVAQAGYAGCGAEPGDNQAVIDARAAADAQCDCATATSHGAYVSCVAGVANDRADNDLLPKNCKGKVKRCAAKSTCGKPGFVTCCVTTSKGPKCKLKRSEQACLDKGGTVNTTHASCCSNTQPITTDACNASPSGRSSFRRVLAASRLD
jgi:hypothetical protein